MRLLTPLLPVAAGLLLPILNASGRFGEPDPEPDVTRPQVRCIFRLGGDDPVSIALQPGGDRVAVGNERTGVVDIRQLPEGKRVARIQTHGISGRVPASLLLSYDGKWLAAASRGKQVKLYPVGGKRSVDLGEALWIEISPMTFRPDSKVLATFAPGDLVRQWQVGTGRIQGSIPLPGRQAGSDTLAFSPDGKLLALDQYVTGRLMQIRLLDAASGKERWQSGSLQTRVSTLAFSPDGRRLAAGSSYGQLQLLDVATGKLLHELKGHTDYLTALAFAPDGRTLVSGARQKGDSTLRFWDVATGRQLAVVKCPRGVWTMTFRPDGSLWTASADGTVRQWAVPRRWNKR
jgi:WD40 repeat protein